MAANEAAIDFKIGVLSFKAINGLAPQYLVEMFTPVAANPAPRRNRSADRGDLFIKTVIQRSSLFNVDRAIPFSCTIVILLRISRGISMCGHYK